jgi:hypothetical protein
MNANSGSVQVIPINIEDPHAPKPTIALFLYNNSLFVAQIIFGLFGVTFSAAMLIRGNDPGIYLPVLTAILGWFFPSPLNDKFDTPSNIQQLRELFVRP